MRATVAFLVSAVALAACNNSISIDDFAQKFRDGECSAAVACNEFPDTATCEASISLDSSDFNTVVAEVKAGTVSYDGDAASQCLAYLTDNVCTFGGFHGGQVCNSIFDGTLANGAACVEDEACKGYKTQTAQCVRTDNMCDPGTTCCPGVCTAIQRAALGASCATLNCANDLYCSGVDQTCKALVPTLGAAYEGYDGCEDPMYCKITSGASTGVCADAAASGGACDTTGDTLCADARQYCDPTTLVCTNDALVGAACSDTVPCVAEANCNTATGKCEAVPTVGQACSTIGGTDCLGDLQCVSNVCTLPGPGPVCM